MGRWCLPDSTRAAAHVAVLFPPQVRDWGLPEEVPLTPRAARRVAREGALHSFDQAALALNEDWGRIWMANRYSVGRRRWGV